MTGVPMKPKNRNASPTVAWCYWAPFGDEAVQEQWVFAPFGEWTIGYRIELAAGVPCIAEQRTWPTDAPFWRHDGERQVPCNPPNLDLARKALSPLKAIEAWRDISEKGDAVHANPRRHGFDPAAPVRRRPDDSYYADVARRYVECRRRSKNYAEGLGRELGVSPSAARKLVMTCKERGLLNADDELAPYTRWLQGVE